MRRRGSQEIIGGHIYEIQELIGEGAYGAVHKAINKSNQTIVAIKIQSEMNEQERDLMEQMKSKTFQNLITIYDFTKDRNNNYLIVMEYCQQSLYDKLKQGNIPKDEIRFIMKEIGNGILELHELGRAHRDLKPENILIQPIKDKAGQVQEKYKLCDFGTAKKIDVLATQKVGTPYYLAPEQIPTNPNSNLKYNQKVDVWAFGTVIYELLTGLPMFNGSSEQEVWGKIARVTQVEIENRINHEIKIERKYKTLLLNMMQIDINKRYSIQDALKELRADSVVVQKNLQFNQKKEEIKTNQQEIKANQNEFTGLPQPQALKNEQLNKIANYYDKQPQQNIAAHQFQFPKKDIQTNQNPNQNLNQSGNVEIEQKDNKKFRPFLSPQPTQNPQTSNSSNDRNNIVNPNFVRSSQLQNYGNFKNSQNSQTINSSNQNSAFIQQGVTRFSQMQNLPNKSDNQPSNVPGPSQVGKNNPNLQFQQNSQAVKALSQIPATNQQALGQSFNQVKPNAKPPLKGEFESHNNFKQNQNPSNNQISIQQNHEFRQSQFSESNFVDPAQENQNFNNIQIDNQIKQNGFQQQNLANQLKVDNSSQQQSYVNQPRIAFPSNTGQINRPIPNSNPKPIQANYFQVKEQNTKNFTQLPNPQQFQRGRPHK